MYTIRALCAKSGLSRSTLLYYDSLGILSPASRSAANYRLYSEENLRHLERICTYRQAGVPLSEIGRILSLDENLERTVLEKTLAMLNRQAQDLRQKQEKISRKLQKPDGVTDPSLWLDKELVFSALKAADFSSELLLKFHGILEGESPEKHKKFLDTLGFTEEEMLYILEKLRRSEEGNDEA